MPSPKSGNAGTPVPPAEPEAALEADNARPGSADQIAANERRNQAGQGKPHKPDRKKKSWIEIELVDEDNHPVAGEAYKVVLPDGETSAEGTLDSEGLARIEGIDPGTCKITFPNLDKNAWRRA
jgi:hypothetical protein